MNVMLIALHENGYTVNGYARAVAPSAHARVVFRMQVILCCTTDWCNMNVLLIALHEKMDTLLTVTLVQSRPAHMPAL